MLKRRWLSLILLFVGTPWCQAQSKVETGASQPTVDERVELLSIVFRLADSSEYKMNTLPAYSSDIDRYFLPYKNHPAVQMAHTLAEKNNVGFDAVMVMAISLSSPPELKPLVPFTADTPDKRWGTDAEKFLPLLRDFYRDTRFADFYAAHQAMYRLAEERFTATLERVHFGWYSRFYGSAPDLAYHLVLGMNNGGGNYGPRLIHSDGRTDLFSIIGCWTHDEAGNPTYPPNEEYLSNIIHEFNHSFINPAVEEHWKHFQSAEQIYAHVATQMQQMAYSSAQVMVDESLVRAAVIIYFQDAGEGNRENLKRIREEQRNGFFWMDRLVDSLRRYESVRGQYPTFTSYIPQIASFYDGLASHFASEAAAFRAQSAHVSGIEPFANHAQNVDASVTTITVTVDKRLDPSAGYSINQGMDGDEHFPITGKPTFAPDDLHLLLPVRLKPNQTYSFVLTPADFATLDGYPVASYRVEFKTKQ